MLTPESQNKLNQTEWENPDNWSSIYFSKKDNRTFVPKRNPKHGKTINFASTSGARNHWEAGLRVDTNGY